MTCVQKQTASVWTNIETPGSAEVFEMFTSDLEAGTVFLNRCDYLDPALAWTGVKNSGRGISLSEFGKCPYIDIRRPRSDVPCHPTGYDQLTHAKSIHMKVKTA